MSKWSGVTAGWPLVPSNGCGNPETLRHLSCPLSSASVCLATSRCTLSATQTAYSYWGSLNARVSSVTISSLSLHFRSTQTHTTVLYRTVQQKASNYLFTLFTQSTSSEDATPWQHKRHFYRTKYRPTWHTARYVGASYMCVHTCMHACIHTYIHTHTHTHTYIYTHTHIHTLTIKANEMYYFSNLF